MASEVKGAGKPIPHSDAVIPSRLQDPSRKRQFQVGAVLILPLLVVGMIGASQGTLFKIQFWFAPEILMTVSVQIFALSLMTYRTWTKPAYAWTVLVLGTAVYVWMCLNIQDQTGRLIALFPDNVPIPLMIYGVGFFYWLSLRKAAINDYAIENDLPLIETDADDQVLVWPDLVYIELICLVVCTVVLVGWSIFLKAPLEEPANPRVTPNPSKAPWYFLGLQELLVYFDPWFAGVLLPGLIVFGLMAIPFIDVSKKGMGYYTFKERPFAISMWMFGFLILWVILIYMGTFLRGPNWNFFAPGEKWDPHRPVALLNVHISDIFWIKMLGGKLPSHYLVREAPGIVLLLGYFAVLPWILAKTYFRKMSEEMGSARYGVLMMLLLVMGLVPIKMVLRWVFNLKYFVKITELFFNI
jgi:hypothetical protein